MPLQTSIAAPLVRSLVRDVLHVTGSVWSPTTLFAGGETGVWVKASDVATMFQLSGGTTAVVANNDPVGYWQDQSGNGNHVIQATAGNRPLYQSAGPGVLFDGSNDVLKRASALTQTTGSAIVRFSTNATEFLTSPQVLVSAADEGTANNWFEIGVDEYGRIYIESNAAGTKHTVIGSSRLIQNTAYTLIVVHDGVDYFVLLNGVEENPLSLRNVGVYAWFGDVANADNFVVGGTVTSGGHVRPWKGTINEVIVTSKDITA
jgi:hypothetical protein